MGNLAVQENKFSGCRVSLTRNLKGESVVVAILPSLVRVSYCTSGFFRAKPTK